jgi:hypothetical protein
MFQRPHQLQEAYQKKEREGKTKNSKPRQALIYNDDTPQNRNGLHFLQSYQHLLPTKGM